MPRRIDLELWSTRIIEGQFEEVACLIQEAQCAHSSPSQTPSVRRTQTCPPPARPLFPGNWYQFALVTGRRQGDQVRRPTAIRLVVARERFYMINITFTGHSCQSVHD